jgi:hypothetical protein
MLKETNDSDDLVESVCSAIKGRRKFMSRCVDQYILDDGKWKCPFAVQLSHQFQSATICATTL